MTKAQLLKFAASARSGRSPAAIAAFVLPLAAAFAVPMLTGSPAAAACLQSGNTVTCSGASITGFGTGTENNLTVTVQPDASITPPGFVHAINLGAGNTASNNGTITLGPVSFGMQGKDNNTLTNNGLIIVGTFGFGMSVANFGSNNNLTNAGTISSIATSEGLVNSLGSGNTLTNSGTINITGLASTGIYNYGASNTIANSGTIALSGSGSIGIDVIKSGNTAVNSGVMSVGDNGVGVRSVDNNTVTNTGGMTVGSNSVAMQGAANNSFTNGRMITLGTGSIGMFVTGNNNVLTNAGTISSTAQSAVGFDLLGSGNAVTNSGAITLTGAGSSGIVADSNGTILNSGTITVGSSTGSNGSGVSLMTANSLTNTGAITSAGANGTAVSIWGDGNTVTNSGLIGATGTAGLGIGVAGWNNTIVNNGTIKGGANGYALLSFGTALNSITNNGTLDGQISFIGQANSLINAGLTTITDPATALASGNMNFGGTFTQTAKGTLALRFDNTGLHDGLNAHQLSLNGTLRAVLQPGLYGSSTTYKDVLTTNAPISGQFANVMTSLAFFGAAATYNANSVDLTLTRVGFGAAPGETANQRAVGNALEAGYSTALTGGAAAFYTRLLQAGSLRVLDQLHGEGTSGTQNTALMAGGLFGQTMDSRMAAWRADGVAGFASSGAALGYAPDAPDGAPQAAFGAILKAPAIAQPRWSAWASGFGAGQSLKGDTATGSASFADRAAGGAIGLDRRVNPDLLLGLAVGGSSATFSVSDRATSGQVEGGHVGAYAMQRFGEGYLSALASYGHFANSTTRTISGLGPDEIAKGSFGSDQVGGRLEIGRTWSFGQIAVTPFAAMQAAQLRQAAYTENSVAGAAPGVLGLSYRAIDVTSLPAFVGAQFDGRFAFVDGMMWAPFVRAAWVHEFRPTRDIAASLTTIPSPSFVVEGARAASDAAKVDLGSRLALNHWFELSARVSGEFSSAGQSYTGSGALKVSW